MMAKDMDFGTRQFWAEVPALLLPSCMARSLTSLYLSFLIHEVGALLCCNSVTPVSCCENSAQGYV